MTRTIYLTQDYKTIVDDEDYQQLAEAKQLYCWHATKPDEAGRVYAVRTKSIHGKKIKIRLHRQLLDAPDGLYVDHINGNTLDNRRANLRLATNPQNTANSTDRPHSSVYRGVYRHTGRKWRAYISGVYLGVFSTPEAAAIAYNKAALEKYGEFARLNEVAHAQ